MDDANTKVSLRLKIKRFVSVSVRTIQIRLVKIRIFSKILAEIFLSEIISKYGCALSAIMTSFTLTSAYKLRYIYDSNSKDRKI